MDSEVLGKNGKEKTKEEEKMIDEKEKIKTFAEKYTGWIILGLMVVMIIWLAASGTSFGQVMINITYWFKNRLGMIGIYVGLAVISTFGNFTVIFPVPYTFALIAVATIPGVNPFIVGLSGAIGATIGEVSAWAIGKSSQEAIGNSEKIKRMEGYVERGWAPLLIFIFAATPLPDDAFLLVLGFVNYPFRKVIPWCLLGKFVLCFISAAIPVWLMHVPMTDSFGEWLFNLYNAGVTDPNPTYGLWLLGLFGVDLEAAEQGIPPETTLQQIVVSAIMWILTVVIVFLLVYIDWDKVFKRKSKEKKIITNDNGEINIIEKDEFHPENILK
ncbi:MAG: YqaA family protein [Promethearchaeota archaeon]